MSQWQSKNFEYYNVDIYNILFLSNKKINTPT